MGRFLSCGIAETIYIENLNQEDKDSDVLARIGQNIDLNLYDRIDKRGNKYIVLKIKKDMFEKYIVDFIEEQSKFLDLDTEIDIKEAMQEIKGKSFDELLQIAQSYKIQHFYYLEGNIVCNAIDYLDSKFGCIIFCDIIDFYSTGKIITEKCNNIFSYLRKNIIESSENPIKTALVITVIG